MTTTLTEILKDRAIPEFVQEQYPMFVSFMEAYLEYLQQQKKPLDVVENLQNYRDIDETVNEFVSHFRNEYLINIPEDVLADKRLLAKQIKNFYLNKGNENSFKFLFRILFNEEMDFYYPKVDILRCSDGKWYEQKSLKVALTDPKQLFMLSSKRITGEQSGAIAIVEQALQFIERDQTIVELSLSDIRGSFTGEENIRVFYIDESGDEQFFIVNLLNIYTDIEMTNAGSGYQVDDQVPVKDQDGNVIATAAVKSVTNGPISSLAIIEGGLGYNGLIREVTILGALPSDGNYEGQSIPTIVPYTLIDSNGDSMADLTFDQIIAAQELAGDGDTIIINDSSTSNGSGAFGVVSRVSNYGEILEVALVSAGSGYSTPTAEVISLTGSDGEVEVLGGGGAISKITLENFPLVLADDLDSDGVSQVEIDFTDTGAGNAQGHLTYGSLGEYAGRWLNEDGHLSSIKVLQDNEYYQDFSYVVKVGQDISQWGEIVKKILHPAGFALFGELSIVNKIDCRPSTRASIRVVSYRTQVQSLHSIEKVNVLQYVIESDGSLTPIP